MAIELAWAATVALAIFMEVPYELRMRLSFVTDGNLVVAAFAILLVLVLGVPPVFHPRYRTYDAFWNLFGGALLGLFISLAIAAALFFAFLLLHKGHIPMGGSG
jgi:hypothetical protein